MLSEGTLVTAPADTVFVTPSYSTFAIGAPSDLTFVIIGACICGWNAGPLGVMYPP